MRYLAIFNRRAGSFSEWEVEQITHVLSSSKRLEGRVVVTTTTSDLVRILEQTKDDIPDILAIGGGDGTASVTLTKVGQIWKRLPRYILPFPCGTICNYTAPFGLSGGLEDKIKKFFRVNSTKSIRAARYVADAADNKKKLRVKELNLLDINGTKGFTFGIGMVPKVLWFYYGKSIREYHQLQHEMKSGKHYQNHLERLFDDKRAGFFYSLIAAFHILVPGPFPFTRTHQFFNERIAATITTPEGTTKDKPLTAVFAASHEYVGFGLDSIAIKPTYRAREQSKKFHTVMYRGTVNQAIAQIARLFRGEKLNYADELIISAVTLTMEQPVLYQVDGELSISDHFTIAYDTTLRIISPFT
jgi:diacylglycerol kinase family enzyme